MLTLHMRHAELPDAVDGLPEVVDELGNEYAPVLATALDHQAEQLAVKRNLLRPAARGNARETRFAEVLACDRGLVAVELQSNEHRPYYVEIDAGPPAEPSHWILAVYGVGRPEIHTDVALVADRLSERYSVSLEQFRYTSPRFEELKSGEGMEAPTPPPEEQLVVARLLADAATRRAAIAIAASGGLLVSDFPRQLPESERARANDMRADMGRVGLVTSQLVVICQRSSAQVARVPSRAALEAMASSGLQCACGRDILSERVEEALTITGLGRELLNGSWWMSVLLMEALVKLGIGYERLLVEQRTGGDEMDCFADISGELTLFELKDKEFSLGNAYSFAAKMGIHRPENAVIVTSAYVGGDAKEHFRRAESSSEGLYDPYGRVSQPKAVRYIEGIERLSSDLAALIEQIYSDDARRILARLLPYASLDASSVLAALAAAHGEESSPPKLLHSDGEVLGPVETVVAATEAPPSV